jgi:hypothetical protein
MNAFLDLAERQIPASVKARRRAAESRRTRAQEKALAERDAMFHSWKRERRAQLDAALAGPRGHALKRLVAFLNVMTLESVGALIDRVRADDWPTADADTRFLVLHLVGVTIMHLRERAGLPSFDDPLFDQPPNAFLRLREILQ